MPARDRPERALIQVLELALNFVFSEPAFKVSRSFSRFGAKRGVHTNPSFFNVFHTQVLAYGFTNCANAPFHFWDEIFSTPRKITFELDPASQMINVAERYGFPCHE